MEGVVENGVQIVTGEKESFLQSSSNSDSISNSGSISSSDIIGKENGGETGIFLIFIFFIEIVFVKKIAHFEK